MNPFLDIYIQGFRKGAAIDLDTLKATAGKFVTPDRSGPGSASDIGIGAGAGAALGGSVGAALGGLSGLVAPGRDEQGNRRSRLRTALRRALLGGAVGGAAGAGYGGYKGLKDGPRVRGLIEDVNALQAFRPSEDPEIRGVIEATRSGQLPIEDLDGILHSNPAVQRLFPGKGWENDVPTSQKAVVDGILSRELGVHNRPGPIDYGVLYRR